MGLPPSSHSRSKWTGERCLNRPGIHYFLGQSQRSGKSGLAHLQISYNDSVLPAVSYRETQTLWAGHWPAHPALLQQESRDQHHDTGRNLHREFHALAVLQRQLEHGEASFNAGELAND